MYSGWGHLVNLKSLCACSVQFNRFKSPIVKISQSLALNRKQLPSLAGRLHESIQDCEKEPLHGSEGEEAKKICESGPVLQHTRWENGETESYLTVRVLFDSQSHI